MKKYIILSTLTLLLSNFTNLKAQSINFPDENFLEYLLLYTNIDTNKDAEIQVSEAEAYTGAFTITGNITNLTGIEYFKNLTSLTLNSAKVNTLNISANKQLERLYIYKSPITKVDITSNTKLIMMDVKENNLLTQFKFGQHSQLQYASLMFNNISEIDVTNCPKLTNLFLTSNNLTSINITKNPRLSELNIASNKISVLDISQNTRLTYLNIGYNKISQLDITKSNLLDTFMIQGNPINTIDVSKTKYLRQFVIDNTDISTIDLSPLSMLQFFYANHSKLKTIDASHNESLIYINAVDNTNMEYINFKNNNNINSIGFFATASPNLKCIQVDDVGYSSSQQLWQKDPGTAYATDCSISLSNNNVKIESKSKIYPNPTKDYLYFDKEAEMVMVFNMLGQQVASFKNTKMIDISHITKGNYIIQVKDSQGVISSMKVIKN